MANKVFTIMTHEYLSKIKSKGFLIVTFLAPLGIILFYGAIIYLSTSFDETEKQLYFVDNGSQIIEDIVSQDENLYELTELNIDELKDMVISGESDGYVTIDDNLVETGKVAVFTSGGGGIGYIKKLRSDVEDVVKGYRIENAGIDEAVLLEIDRPIKVSTNKLDETGKTATDATEAKSIFGMIFGFIMYFLIFIYGSFVSRGVIEEKSNRIIEIIASSARPKEILLGKILGIGAMGLTQIIIWLVIISSLLGLIGTLGVFPDADTLAQASASQPGMSGTESTVDAGMAQDIMNAITNSIGLDMIIGFIFFFIGGYFTYSALYAALGAAVDNEQDAQQLQLPISLPIFISLGLITPVSSNPDGVHSIIFSLFPLTSPILMPARMAATNVPVIELIASALLLILGFFGILWVSAKIYRIGMLSTGKKPSFKDIIKWIRTD
ncbi:MAG: ABC transporter permease [Candidatus Kapaibacteriales bacterium]